MGILNVQVEFLTDADTKAFKWKVVHHLVCPCMRDGKVVYVVLDSSDLDGLYLLATVHAGKVTVNIRADEELPKTNPSRPVLRVDPRSEPED